MMGENTNALEEIRVIRRMMEESGSYTGRLWLFLLIWGGALLAGSIISQMLVHAGRWQMIWPVWLVFFVTAAALSSFAGRQDAKASRRVTFLDRAVGTTWTGLTVTMLLLMLVSALGGPPLAPAIPFVVGAGHFAMAGMLLERTWLVGAGLWWLGGILMLVQPELTFAILGLLVLLVYVLPGLRGWRRARAASLRSDG